MTIFDSLGLNSKSVVALAAVYFMQQGKLDLDEENRKLVSWKVTENEFTRDKKITLRRLLRHSA